MTQATPTLDVPATAAAVVSTAAARPRVGSPPRHAARLRRGSALARRAIDVAAAAALLLLTAPLGLAAAALLVCRGPVLAFAPRVGRRGRVFALVSFHAPKGVIGTLLRRTGLDRLPVLWNLLIGNLSLVGPRAIAPDELSPASPLARRRHVVRPGLVCLWWIRRRANIAYGSEWEADLEYLRARSLLGDAAILLRALGAAVYGTSRSTVPQIELFGLRIDNLTMSEAVRRIVAQLDQAQPRQVCFVNADCVNLSFRHADYRRALHSAWLTLPDGIGMKLAGRVLGQPIRQNVCGTDLFVVLLGELEKTDKKLFLLGGRPGVADGVRRWIERVHPGVQVAGCQHGYFSPLEEEEVVRQIVDSGADLLLVGFGAPRQDLWIQKHLAATGVRVALGVGGLFDYYSGRVPRAPLWVRELGMEWLFRLGHEPARLWRRYLVGNLVFLARVAWHALVRR